MFFNFVYLALRTCLNIILIYLYLKPRKYQLRPGKAESKNS